LGEWSEFWIKRTLINTSRNIQIRFLPLLEIVAPRRYRSSYSIDVTQGELDEAEATAIPYVPKEPSKYYKRLRLYCAASFGYPDFHEPGLVKAPCWLSVCHRYFRFGNESDAKQFFIWASANVEDMHFALQSKRVKSLLD
jgi:hypothetical protein